MAGIGIRGAGMIPISHWPTGALGTPPLDFAAGTFTAGMAKRATGVFAASPIVQGKWDGTGTSDVLSLSRGTLLANPTGYFYTNFDPYQGSVVFWWTPEKTTTGTFPECYVLFASINYSLMYVHNLGQWRLRVGAQNFLVNAAVTAGTRYFITATWDTKNTLDGTNYARLSINDVHSYGITTQPTISAPDTTWYLGSNGGNYAADALIQGLTIYRRPIYDGTYGKDVGNGDEIALMHAAGAGADPCLITGSWDVCLCVPTNASAGQLSTGTGNAWSHPHGSNIPDVWGMWDGGYLCEPYVVEFNGTSTTIDCGSGATLDDLPDATFTGGMWIREDADAQHWFIVKGSFSAGGSGWAVYRLTGEPVQFRVHCATTDSVVYLPVGALADGKFHYVAWHFDDAGARRAYISVDGKWASAGNAAVGAYVSDAAHSLYVGRWGDSALQFFEGGAGWIALWSDDHHTAGTDFTPSRTAPTPGGNLVECWHMDEGTGTTAAAQVTSPANDGTITSGSWSAIWEQEGTPVIPQSIESGDTTVINCGSGATLDDLPIGANGFTAEAWVRPDVTDGYQRIFSKDNATTGWALYLHNNQWAGFVRYPGTSTTAYVNVPNGDDSIWHHIALTYDEGGDRRARVWIDGKLSGTGAISAGVYATDAALVQYVSSYLGAYNQWEGGIGWVRISDTVRYSATFVPPSRFNPPAVDGNTMMQLNMTDGAGATVNDSSGNANHGTASGNYSWLCTPDMALDEPGARVYNNGYNIGSDGADDGIVIETAPTNPSDTVLRLFCSYSQDGRAWPICDFNGTEFKLPRMHDVHTGANNSATLINANGNFTQQLVGWKCYNITDGSSGTITAVSGDKTTITVTLAGGTDNDFDTNDVYIIRPPNGDPYCYHPIATEAIWVLRTAAAAVDLKIKNEAGEGGMQIHQQEAYESLLDGGDMDAGAGNPWIPDGWTNDGLDPGDSSQGAVIHSGIASLQYNAGAAADEGVYVSPALVAGTFYANGGWFYGEGSDSPNYQWTAARMSLQAALSSEIRLERATAVWQHAFAVGRGIGAGAQPLYILGDAGIGGASYIDDLYCFVLTPITLTATPASQANSLETAGLRIDGYDICTQAVPAGYFAATAGWMRWRWTPRHSAALLAAFGNTGATLLHAWGNATNYIRVYATAANNIRLEFNDGGGVHQANWNCTGAIVAGTSYKMEVRYVASDMWLIVNDAVVATITTPITFATVPTTLYWSSQQPGGQQADAAYAAP